MSQKQTRKRARPRKGQEKPRCHVHDEVYAYAVDEIRQNVCVNELPFTEHKDGKYYCLFHLPAKDKDSVKFLEIFKLRLDAVGKEISRTEDLPEEARADARTKISYDFRYVWFPCEINVNKRIFGASADFSSATFFDNADFDSTTFSDSVAFMSATFCATAKFRTTFSAAANFSDATFSSYAYFYATFSGNANFRGTTFSADAHFDSATFSAVVKFISASFAAKAYFRATFSGAAYFNSATFEYAYINSTFSASAVFDSANFTAAADFIGTTFSANAVFGSATFSAAADFTGTTFSANADFGLVKFVSNADFSNSTFEKICNFFKARFYKEIKFENARFNGGANFYYTHFFDECNFSKSEFFKEKTFRNAKFHKEANFKWTKFSDDTFFDKARFRQFVDFGSAEFTNGSDTLFRKTGFCSNANFGFASIAGYITFESQEQNVVFRIGNFLNFQNMYTESAKRIAFNHVPLRPSWFVNTDTRHFIFKDVSWENVGSDFTRANVKAELDKLESFQKNLKRKVENPTFVFKIVCRQLAENAENNSRFDEASNFRRMAMETEWREKKERLKSQIKRLRRPGRNVEVVDSNLSRPFFTAGRAIGDIFIHALYRITSFYGENSLWAAVMLFGILLFFALLYTSPLSKFDYSGKSESTAGEQLNFIDRVTCKDSTASPRSMNLCEGISYSLYLTALQRPEPKPHNNRTKFLGDSRNVSRAFAGGATGPGDKTKVYAVGVWKVEKVQTETSNIN